MNIDENDYSMVPMIRDIENMSLQWSMLNDQLWWRLWSAKGDKTP